MKSRITFLLAILVLSGMAFPAELPIDPVAQGAAGDGVADDTAALQKALDAAATGPKLVLLRPGTYLIKATLNVPDGVSLAGMSPRWEDSSTRVVVRDKGFSAVRLNNFSNVRGLAFVYPNNKDGDHPDEYPPTILITGINPSVESVVFDSAWIGIAPPPEGANTGQCLFRDITGFTHKVGIRLDGIKDIARIEDVHWFVPAYGGDFYRRERVGFEIGATDGIIMRSCFMIGGKTFFHQQKTTGQGEPVHSLGHHISQCWTEAVKYGFLIEGTCGLVLSDTQIYVSDPEGAGIAMRMPHLYYHSTVSNTQIRCDGSQALGVEYTPVDDHPRNHFMLSHCEIVEASTGVRIGDKAKRVWITENHIAARDVGIDVAPSAQEVIVKDNIVSAARPILTNAEGQTKMLECNIVEGQ